MESRKYLVRSLLGALVGGLAAFLLKKAWSRGAQASPNRPTVTQTEAQAFIGDNAEQVYAIARDLPETASIFPSVSSIVAVTEDTYRAVVGEETVVQLEVIIIADEPGEYFGFRIEHEGSLYATCLLHFSIAPGAKGTIARALVRYKNMPPALATAVKPLAEMRIVDYLLNLKQLCEREHELEQVL